MKTISKRVKFVYDGNYTRIAQQKLEAQGTMLCLDKVENYVLAEIALMNLEGGKKIKCRKVGNSVCYIGSHADGQDSRDYLRFHAYLGRNDVPVLTSKLDGTGREKTVDSSIVKDILMQAFHNDFDYVVLFTGDGDFKMVADLLRNEDFNGTRKKMFVIYSKANKISSQLKNAVEYAFEIPSSNYEGGLSVPYFTRCKAVPFNGNEGVERQNWNVNPARQPINITGNNQLLNKIVKAIKKTRKYENDYVLGAELGVNVKIPGSMKVFLKQYPEKFDVLDVEDGAKAFMVKIR